MMRTDVDEKKCSKCRAVKSFKFFSKSCRSKDGHQNYCKQCDNAQKREYIKSRKDIFSRAQRKLIDRNTDIVWGIKSKASCEYCRKSFPPECMDFHHLSEKTFPIPTLVRVASKIRLLEEIKKCVVICAVCHRIITNEPFIDLPEKRHDWWRKVRLVNDIKESLPCTDCAQKFPHYAMDFDHVSGIKTSSISRLRNGYSHQKLFTEISKCELVCANCHRIRTYSRKHWKSCG